MTSYMGLQPTTTLWGGIAYFFLISHFNMVFIVFLFAGLMKKFGRMITRCQNGGGSRASPLLREQTVYQSGLLNFYMVET